MTLRINVILSIAAARRGKTSLMRSPGTAVSIAAMCAVTSAIFPCAISDRAASA